MIDSFSNCNIVYRDSINILISQHVLLLQTYNSCVSDYAICVFMYWVCMHF